MVIGLEYSREMRRGEEDQVDALLRAAFEGPEEAQLVHALRKGRHIAGEMVLPSAGAIVGYYALSYMVAPKGWLCLAPVAIAPEVQGQRNGRRMMGLLTEWARASGTYVVVLGAVPFYEKAGFSQARAAKLTSPYPVSHTMIAGPGNDTPVLKLVYPKPFDALE